MKTEKIMGIPIDNITYETIIADISSYLNSDKKMTAISINPQIVLEVQHYKDLQNFIHASTHRIPDGIGIVLVSKLLGGNIKERVTGFDLMVKFLEYANEHRKRCFFYGAKPEVNIDLINNIQKKYPNLIIAGGIDGYTKLDDDEIVNQINTSKPDFLFVALGFPKQEKWLSKNIDVLEVSILQNVGGSFDVLSGHVKRAPDFYVKNHLEWLYRSLSNPKRIGRIFQLPIFVLKSLFWHIRGK
ncbi:WecB/TagA/CpsF family glycosyltransferase [Enterococcus saccharolyticus]|uniref:WecB/TagA/CpsF family glycosyltransferase n=1 Tax=Enterococcus TaxID=1350 RepID=UPI001E589647|nr:WecB/TagA/CpsF family glycosyltransferase [Enterococcus saccharolyticus]MCD5003737.1 WecB/TagA/CpsF family glycosyltransferase [Enterococcus saccharolyticus]